MIQKNLFIEFVHYAFVDCSCLWNFWTPLSVSILSRAVWTMIIYGDQIFTEKIKSTQFVQPEFRTDSNNAKNLYFNTT